MDLRAIHNDKLTDVVTLSEKRFVRRESENIFVSSATESKLICSSSGFKTVRLDCNVLGESEVSAYFTSDSLRNRNKQSL